MQSRSHLYSKTNKKLENLLKSIDRPSDFCVQWRNFLLIPQIEVSGTGLLSHPVPESQCESLIQSATPLESNANSLSIVDANTTNCWQINQSHIKLSGICLGYTAKTVKEVVAKGIGVRVDQLNLKLDQLIIAGHEGEFTVLPDKFRPSEKIATLLVSLPTVGGGDLQVYKKTEKKRLS